VLRWQADTGQPGSLIGGYFLGPNAAGKVSFDYQPPARMIVAAYLNELRTSQRHAGLTDAEVRAAIESWRTAAIVVVSGKQSVPLERVLTRIYGRPTLHIGVMFSWLLHR
jgi:hypothetical protein